MDRQSAAALIGVEPDASHRDVDAAYRARARAAHPDRVPTWSPAWRGATAAMQQLNEARRVLRADVDQSNGTSEPTAARGAGESPCVDADAPVDVTGAGVRYVSAAWAESLARSRPASRPQVFRSLPEALRRARNRAVLLGLGLLAAAVGSLALGATQPVNSALPVWSPGLAVVGCVSLAVAAQAQRRLAMIRRG